LEFVIPELSNEDLYKYNTEWKHIYLLLDVFRWKRRLVVYFS
jgi:hypothetical protein